MDMQDEAPFFELIISDVVLGNLLTSVPPA